MSATVTYPGPGCVVEYMDGNAAQIALVLEEQSGKLRLLLPGRREVKMTAARLLPWAGPVHALAGREAAIAVLERHRTQRENTAAAIDVMEVWHIAQGEVSHATAQWFAELCVDTPDADTVAAYGRALLACKSHYKFHAPHFEIYPADVVAQRLAEQEATRQREALISGGAAFFRMLFEVETKKRALPPPDDPLWPAPEILVRLERMVLARIADPECSEDDILWRTLVKGLPDLTHMPLHLASAWGLVPAHHNFWLNRADYSPGDTWAAAFEYQTRALIKSGHGAELPFLDMPFVSIDGASTRDVDDAFYVESLPAGVYRLYLVLACPALDWPFDSPLDKAVARRATSIYLPETTHHMMPEVLGADIYSLCAGLLRPALCCVCEVDNNGALLSFVASIVSVRLAANLVYEDCEAMLEGAAKHTAAAPYAAQLALGEELALTLQRSRIAAGAVIMDRPDPKIIVETDNTAGADMRVTLKESPPAPRAQQLVAEFMILISTACAQYAQEKGIALLHRTQDVAIPKEYAGVWTAPHDIARIIRALAPSCLEVQPRNHAGLGVLGYSPITSPLRRYADLLNESQIVSYIRTGSARLHEDSLKALLPALSARLEAAGQVQRFRPRYWKLFYVRQQGDKIWWDAVITEENDYACTISLPREQLIVRCRRHYFGERACAGQAVRVRLGKVSPLYNEISILEVADV